MSVKKTISYEQIAERKRIETYKVRNRGYNAGLMMVDCCFLLMQNGVSDDEIRAYLENTIIRCRKLIKDNCDG